ncbi:unnamed protein product [Calicophoron daubneyi]|uniref:Uncharacterized protein n=1 Tax=Calicophoron daubneyi TaxID=300641 RepID=A0AAV2TM07_CALDB
MGLPCKKRPKEDKADRKVELKKEINVFHGIGIVVGVIIGSGIFVSPVGVLKYTESIGLSLVMWLATGLFSALGAVVYAELGVTIPRSGGEYIYILESFGPLPAFVALWITLAVIGGASTAANTILFAQYILRPFYPDCELPRTPVQLVALFGLLTLCFINCYRVTWSTKLSVIFTISKVSALLLIIGFGIYYLSTGHVQSFSDPFEGSATSPGSLALSFYQGFWAFSGWNYLNFLTGELKNPARTLPIVIISSLSLVTIVYLLANVAYLGVLSPLEVLQSGEGSAAIAVSFANRCMGVMAWVMPVFVGASVFGSANGEVLSMSRLAFTAGEEGHMPVILSTVSITNLTPIPSVLVVVILAIGFQLHPNVFYLIELTGLAFSVISSMAVASLLYIRRVHPEMNQGGFKLPVVIPLIYLIGNICIGGLTVYQAPKESAVSLGLMATGIPIYLIFVAWTRKPRTFRSAVYNMTIGIQKLFNVVPQETGSTNAAAELPISAEGEPDDTWRAAHTP